MRKLWRGLFCLGVLLVLIILIPQYRLVITDKPGRINPPTGYETRLTAEVWRTATGFTVQNRDAFDWLTIRLGVSSETDPWVIYIVDIRRMTAGSVHLIDGARFVTSDGIVFNPRLLEFLNFGITCHILGRRGHGWYYTSINEL